MRQLDLQQFDPEYMELLRVEYCRLKDVTKIELRLKCLVVGWHFKKKLLRVAKAFGVGIYLKNSCIEKIITITFFNIHNLQETLLSEGGKVANQEPSSSTYLEGIIFDVEELGISEISKNLFHIRLVSEGLTLEFDCQDYTYESKCLEA